MLSIKQCSFCGRDVMPAHGLIYVKNDGTTLQFCSSKCRKNSLHLKRDPRKYKWTQKFNSEGKQ